MATNDTTADMSWVSNTEIGGIAIEVKETVAANANTGFFQFM